MTAEEYCEEHGATFVKWLQENTVECACEHKYGYVDETKRRGEEIDVQTELSLIHISEPTRRYAISYAVFCLKKKI